MNLTVDKKDTLKALKDFETFCDYIEEKRPKLTPARKELCKKECFELDKLLSYQMNFAEPKYLQVAYPSINLWFHVSLTAGLFMQEQNSKDSIRKLIPTERLKLFKKLNPDSKDAFMKRVSNEKAMQPIIEKCELIPK